MPKKDKYIPWTGVGVAALIFAAAGREIALRSGLSSGTANLVFIIIIVVSVLIYLLFIELAEPVARMIEKRRRNRK